MQTYVLWKFVPDTVEELTVAADGTSLDCETARFMLSDADEHALEEALLLKERHGGTVIVVALDAPEVDDALYTALAKGADRAVKIAVDQTQLGSVATAKVFGAFFGSQTGAITSETLLLPGSQAVDDLEGELAPFLAEALHLPYVGVVCGVAPAEGKAVVLKEFAGGVRGEFEVGLPAVLGIQSAEKPPRYVPVAKVRAAMKSAAIETVTVDPPAPARSIAVDRMFKPEVAGRAQMLEGTPAEVAERIADLLAERDLFSPSTPGQTP